MEHRLQLPSTVLTPLLPGLQGLLAGPWLFAGVLGGLIIRKPGAALYTELVAAVISALIGNQWGPLTIVSGLVQGLGAELVFFLFLYASWRLPVAMLAGAGAGLACGINDRILWYPGADTAFTVDLHREHDRLGRRDRGSGVVADRPRSRGHGGAAPLRVGPRGLATRLIRRMRTVRPAAVAAEGWAWRHATRLKWALSDVSFRIDPGERVLLLGASGSGKSTLLHGLAGVLGGDDEGESRGALLVDGMPAADARGRAALVLQDPDSQAILARVGDDVAFGAENLGVPREEIWRRVRHALEAVGLDVALDRSTSALSGGQKQRLALAGAIAMRSGVLLLDEPTANLDPDGVLRGARRGRAGARCHRCDPRRRGAPPRGLAADHRPRDRARRGRGGRRRVARRRARGARAGAGGRRACGCPASRPLTPARPRRARAGSCSGPSGLAVARVRGTPVAAGIDVEVRGGEVLGITGPNGAGKTTLGLTLAGLLPPHAGRVRASEDLARGAQGDPIRWSSRQLLTRIGTVMQDPEHQLLATTVRAELEVGPRALGLGDQEIGGARRRSARAPAPRRGRRSESVHAFGRREAAADGGRRARHPARRSSCSTSRPSDRMPARGPNWSRSSPTCGMPGPPSSR